MAYTYLRERSHYEDLYDRGTVEECRRIERVVAKSDESKESKEYVQRVLLHFTSGDRYAARGETIQEWMSRDRLKDEKVANAKEPGATCPECGMPMSVEGRELFDWHDDKPARVAFWYECTQRQAER
jgi:hypothetical protein